MKNYDLAIIGGGISGLSAALILSAGIKANGNLKDKSIAIFDAGGSDALKAKFFNAPGVKQGTSGKKAISKLVDQVQSYGIAKLYNTRVTEIIRSEECFNIKTKKEKEFSASNLLLATGFRNWNIEGLDLPIKPFTRTDNNSRVAIEHKEYKVKDNIYVCGLLSDVSSHYPIVAGTGAQAAINIMYDWSGQWIVIHDK